MWRHAANLLTILRLVTAPALVALAAAGRRRAFLVVLMLLLATDWLDGKVASATGTTSALGARLDSVADAVMFGAVLASAAWLLPDTLAAVAPLLAATAGSWITAVAVSVARFSRLASYHTWSAKAAWWAIAAGAVAAFAGGPDWPLRVGLAVAIAANLESVAISVLLRAPRADVRSVLAAWRGRARSGDGASGREGSPHDRSTTTTEET